VTDVVSKACRIALDRGFAEAGYDILITAGVLFGPLGATSLIGIAIFDNTSAAVAG
jgi:pyruvate kinase